MVKEILSSQDLDSTIKTGVVCVDFWAPWCGPCVAFAPTFEEVANELQDVVFAKVNIDELSDVATAYRVKSIPTIILFKDGKVAEIIIGRLMKQELMNKVNNVK